MTRIPNIGETSTCRRCDEPIEYVDSWESPLWVHRGRYGEWPGWCDPKLCHADPQPTLDVHTYGKVAYVGVTAEAAATIQKINEENRAKAKTDGD